MKEQEVLSILRNIGWISEKDEAGDHFCFMQIEELLIQIIPTIRERPDHFRISFMESVSTKTFTEAATYIGGRKTDHCPIVLRNALPLKVNGLTEEDIAGLSKEIISWAISQDIEKGLAQYRALPTNSKGAMPLRHLTALAIAKEVERLTFYKENFNEGIRLDFVPYVDVEMIQRALFIAQSEQS